MTRKFLAIAAIALMLSVLSCAFVGCKTNCKAELKTASSEKPSSGAETTSKAKDDAVFMPKDESGMHFVYDGAGALIKMESSDNTLYYFPGNSKTPEKYRSSTWFAVDPAVKASGDAIEFNIDEEGGLEKATEWVKSHADTKHTQNIIKSLKNQQGTKITIYYEGKIK